MKKVVFANTLSQLIGRAVSAGTLLFITVLVAGRFGAQGYGDFIKITTYVAFFYLLADFGINAIFLHDKDRTLWPALVGLRTIGSSVLILLSVVVVFLLPSTATGGYTPAVRYGILLLSPTILFQALITSANAVFQKRLRYDLATWAIFFGSIVTAVGVWLVTRSAVLDVLLVVTVLVVGLGVTTALSLGFANRLENPRRFIFFWGQVKQLFLPSIPLGITLLFNLVYFRADSIILTVTRPTSEVGIYGLAYKAFEVFLVFPTFFMNAVYPLLVGQHPDRVKSIVVRSSRALTAASLVAAGIVWAGAPTLALIKSDFAASVPALRVLSLGLPFFFLSSLFMWALIALKKQTVLALVYGGSMAGNIIANILLIPVWGYMAAAWITVGSEFVVLVLTSWLVLWYLRDNTR